MASIKFRADRGQYQARYRDKETGREHAKLCKTRKAAQTWLDEKTADIVRGDWTDPTRAQQTFHTFAVEWAESMDWKQTTRDGFPAVLKRCEAVLPKDATLGSIDALTIKRARTKLAAKYADATVTLTMVYLSAIMRAAYQTRRVSADPTVGTKSQRRRGERPGKVGPLDVPTRDEVVAILQATDQRFRAGVALGASGCRIGEVLGLTVDRVDLSTGFITIDRQLQRIGGEVKLTTPKGEKPRTIKVAGFVVAELRRHLDEGTPRADGLLFDGRRGAAMRRDYFYDAAWRPALIGAGFAPDRFVFHSLRHFCASSMLAVGVSPMAVAGHLGDSLETLQRVYAHWMRDDRGVAADAMDQLFENLADQTRTKRLRIA